MSDHFGPFLHFGPFWTVLTILDRFDNFGPFGPFWTILDRFGPFGPFWTIWNVFDHFDRFGPFGLFGPMLVKLNLTSLWLRAKNTSTTKRNPCNSNCNCRTVQMVQNSTNGPRFCSRVRSQVYPQITCLNT